MLLNKLVGVASKTSQGSDLSSDGAENFLPEQRLPVKGQALVLLVRFGTEHDYLGQLKGQDGHQQMPLTPSPTPLP